MSKLCSMESTFAALTLAAGMHATNPAFAQNINDLLTIFGGDRQQARRHKLPRPSGVVSLLLKCPVLTRGCGVKVRMSEALVRRGVKPSAARLIELRSGCRQSAEGVQTGTAPASARDATDSSTPNVPASNQTEPKDAGVTLPTIGCDASLHSAESDVRVAEEHVPQGNVEPKNTSFKKTARDGHHTGLSNCNSG